MENVCSQSESASIHTNEPIESDSTTLDKLLERPEQPRQWRGRRVRALRPLADDRALLSAINHGELAINGFRNCDLRAIFLPQITDVAELFFKVGQKCPTRTSRVRILCQ